MTIEPGTVSHGTLRYVDLIPTFYEFLMEAKESDPRADIALHLSEYQTLVNIFALVEGNGSDADLSDDDLDAASYLLEKLVDALNDLAPEHYYFGTHPGDGSDFGFWLEDDLRECDQCGRITDAGEWPDWINGKCEECDPDILTHPENVERLP